MSVDRAFLADLRSALTHLGDPAYLENHPLTERLSLVRRRGDLSRGQALRQALRVAIESLDPGANIPVNAPEARPYQALRYRYIARQSMLEVAARLNLGERQAYRELQRGVVALARVLGDAEAAAGTSPEALPTRAEKVREEIERLSAGGPQEVDLIELVGNAVQSVSSLAKARRVAIRVHTSPGELRVTAPRVMLRQAFVNILSHLIRHERKADVRVTAQRLGASALVRLAYHPQTGLENVSPEAPYAVATELLNTLGIPWEARSLSRGTVELRARIPLARKHTVLIVDDNEGIIALFRGYLRREPYVVHGATSVAQALELMPALRPDVVILDVMMPDRDGWEALQVMRLGQSHTPRVVICSIIDDPELSASLGADAFLHKPVDRAALLQALDQLLHSTADA
ncbi:MAG: response regulator [Anaerolineae bacterium]|nr:response regulator [Anaerolineae bacterium]